MHLFAALSRLQVRNSHGDKLTKLPRGSNRGRHGNSPFAASRAARKNCSAFNSIPKSSTRRAAKEIIANFVHGVCGCGKNWTMRNYVEQAIAEIRRQVGGKR